MRDEELHFILATTLLTSMLIVRIVKPDQQSKIIVLFYNLIMLLANRLCKSYVHFGPLRFRIEFN